MDDFYSHKKESKKKGEYIYYNPECKECTKQRSEKWIKENPTKRKQMVHKYDTSEKGRTRLYKSNVRYRNEGKYLKWQRENKDKIKEYNLMRNLHKKHDISIDEWVKCKLYFDNSCAYCGMTYEDHLKEYKQDLHKEHVDPDGVNNITNCVPACKACNVSKWKYDLNDWYPQKDFFDNVKLSKIYKWLYEDLYKLNKELTNETISNE